MYSYEALFTEDEIKRLVSFGFCDMGDGIIGRMTSRVDKFRLSTREGRNMNGTSPEVIEYLWRKHFGQKFAVGYEYARLFPPSASTVTMYIMLDDGDHEFVRDVDARVERWNTDEGARQARVTAAERQDTYTAEAIF